MRPAAQLSQSEHPNHSKFASSCQVNDRVRGGFATILEGARPAMIRSLLNQAGAYNRLAKSSLSARSRQALYARKASTISRLIELGAGLVDECLLGRGLVTIALPNDRCLHVPIDRLSPAARGIVKATLLQRFDDGQLHVAGAR